MLNFRRFFVLFMAVSLLAISCIVSAGDQPGQIKADTCIGCHGIEGYQNAYPRYRVPRIAGQHEAYIVAALKAYRSGERKHPTMTLQAESLSDQDIAEIAKYISTAGQ